MTIAIKKVSDHDISQINNKQPIDHSRFMQLVETRQHEALETNFKNRQIDPCYLNQVNDDQKRPLDILMTDLKQKGTNQTFLVLLKNGCTPQDVNAAYEKVCKDWTYHPVAIELFKQGAIPAIECPYMSYSNFIELVEKRDFEALKKAFEDYKIDANHLNRKNEAGLTPLNILLSDYKKGMMSQIFVLLLDHGCQVESLDALFKQVCEEYRNNKSYHASAIAQALVQRGIVNENYLPFENLMDYLKYGRNDQLRECISEGRINSNHLGRIDESSGDTPLTLICRGKYPLEPHLLINLASSESLYAENTQRKRPIDIAREKNDRIVEDCIERTIKKLSKQQPYQTISSEDYAKCVREFFEACKTGDKETVRNLLSNRSVMRYKNLTEVRQVHNRNAFHIACLHGHKKIIESLLIFTKFSHCDKDAFGKKPVDIAREKKFYDCSNAIRRHDYEASEREAFRNGVRPQCPWQDEISLWIPDGPWRETIS